MLIWNAWIALGVTKQFNIKLMYKALLSLICLINTVTKIILGNHDYLILLLHHQKILNSIE